MMFDKNVKQVWVTNQGIGDSLFHEMMTIQWDLKVFYDEFSLVHALDR